MYKNKLKIFIVFILVLSFGIVNLNGAYAEDRWGGVSTQQSTVPSVTSDGMSQSYASQNVEVRKDLEKVNKSKKGWDITKAVMGATAALGAGVAIAGFVAPGLDQNARTAMIATGLPVAAGAGVTAFIADGQSKELRRKSLNLEGRIEDNWDAMTRNAQVGQDIVFADTMKQGGFSNSSTNAMHAGAVEDIYFGPAGGGNVPNQNGNNPPNNPPATPPTRDIPSGGNAENGGTGNNLCCFVYTYDSVDMFRVVREMLKYSVVPCSPDPGDAKFIYHRTPSNGESYSDLERICYNKYIEVFNKRRASR